MKTLKNSNECSSPLPSLAPTREPRQISEQNYWCIFFSLVLKFMERPVLYSLKTGIESIPNMSWQIQFTNTLVNDSVQIK